MACGGCGGARRMVGAGMRAMGAGNVRGGLQNVVGGIRQAVRVNAEKIRGSYDDSRYQDDAVNARPYRRPVERST